MISGGIKVDVKTVRPISGETSIPKTNLSGATPSAVSGGFERAKAPSHILSGGAGALGVKRFQAKETPAEYAAKVASGAIPIDDFVGAFRASSLKIEGLR